MAGITDGRFCSKMAPHGFDLVTIGGYNLDQATIKAGRRIIQRGRTEFDFSLKEIMPHINQQIQIIKDNKSWDGLISVNIRSITPDPVIEISKLKNVDVVEINAHCRQPEITALGCGQALLENLERLNEYTRKVVEKSKSKVSVKVRANVPGVDDVLVAKKVKDAGADFLHIDAMKPGYNGADLKIIRTIKENSDIYLIGNNSIRDLQSARDMIAAGADGISIARALIGEKIPFDLSQI